MKVYICLFLIGLGMSCYSCNTENSAENIPEVGFDLSKQQADSYLPLDTANEYTFERRISFNGSDNVFVNYLDTVKAGIIKEGVFYRYKINSNYEKGKELERFYLKGGKDYGVTSVLLKPDTIPEFSFGMSNEINYNSSIFTINFHDSYLNNKKYNCVILSGIKIINTHYLLSHEIYAFSKGLGFTSYTYYSGYDNYTVEYKIVDLKVK